MVLDTSAVIAVLQNEPEAPRLAEALEAEPVRRWSAASLVEAGIVMQARYGDHGEREVDLFAQRLDVDVVPVMVDHAEIARSAFRRYGKRRHPAGLNFGDCFSYALAIALGEPLLFVGTDFGHTDVLVASY
ncbi:MAG TPA: type II toxin-antitoxin system VapC family toxin [Gemmatimonadota bacterium]|nr:type II toxin-antitoxin system VapC family toxin [Gemmatimonadota bacterium]